MCCANCSTSLTWIEAIWRCFPYKNQWSQGSGEQWGRYNLPKASQFFHEESPSSKVIRLHIMCIHDISMHTTQYLAVYCIHCSCKFYCVQRYPANISQQYPIMNVSIANPLPMAPRAIRGVISTLALGPQRHTKACLAKSYPVSHLASKGEEDTATDHSGYTIWWLGTIWYAAIVHLYLSMHYT